MNNSFYSVLFHLFRKEKVSKKYRNALSMECTWKQREVESFIAFCSFSDPLLKKSDNSPLQETNITRHNNTARTKVLNIITKTIYC